MWQLKPQGRDASRAGWLWSRVPKLLKTPIKIQKHQTNSKETKKMNPKFMATFVRHLCTETFGSSLGWFQVFRIPAEGDSLAREGTVLPAKSQLWTSGSNASVAWQDQRIRILCGFNMQGEAPVVFFLKILEVKVGLINTPWSEGGNMWQSWSSTQTCCLRRWVWN